MRSHSCGTHRPSVSLSALNTKNLARNYIKLKIEKFYDIFSNNIHFGPSGTKITDASSPEHPVQSNLGSRTPRITNSLVYEQIFRTQSVSDNVLCLELRTRKLSNRRQKQITLDNFLVRQRPSGSEAESSWC